MATRDESIHCRECGVPLARVAPRSVVCILPEAQAKAPRGKNIKPVLGHYCCADHALNAYHRGIPRHH